MIGRFTFGEFVLDRDTRELRRGRDVVSLSPKAFQLLGILIEHQPKAMDKKALQALLWPNTFVVDKNLANLVAEIRDALGDEAANPRFVRTVPRFGYAFQSAPVAAVAEGLNTMPEGAPHCRLTWEGGRAALCEGEHVVGRDAEAALFLDSPSVSRRHAILRVSASDTTVEDLGSKNGTFVAGRRIDAPTSLADGDAIKVGAFTLTFTLIRTDGVTETW